MTDQVTPQSFDDSSYLKSMERLILVVQELSLARDLQAIMRTVRHAARELTGADGATFVLREGDLCHYADEEAIAPLWKGRRFPMSACISGWAMQQRRPAVIGDIYADPRIPHDAYRPTFVKSLVMVPIRTLEPIGAIGNYWANRRTPDPRQVALLQALADTTAVAMENVRIYQDLEQRVRDRTAALEAANEDLQSFSYSVSHDLRAPIRSIGGFCRLLAEDHKGQLDAEMKRKLGIISSEAQRMSQLIDGLLEFSRLGRAALRPTDINMEKLAMSVFDRLTTQQEGRPVQFRLNALPRAVGDAALLEHVWSNLLSNEIKYSSKKNAPVIEVDGASGENEHAYSVRDNGAGFDPRYQSRLFGVFQRLHHEDEFPGTGVGLAHVKRILARHGGRIWAESAPGEGATFHFALPVVAEPAGPGSGAPSDS
jgi:hypothetical protein